MTKRNFFPKRWWTRLNLVALVIVAGPYVFSRVMSPVRCVSVHTSTDTNAVSTLVGPLRIACYNIAHGRGTALTNWTGGNEAARLARLDQIADSLREMDADIVILNEVDFDSSWSGSVNQARYLAEHAGYQHRVEQRNLDFRVLVWKWRFGNAILSKYPIVNSEVLEFPGYSIAESIMAGKKRAVMGDIDLGDQTVRVVGVHLSHRSESVRVGSVLEIAKAARASELPVMVAGDMNSTPSGFPGSGEDQSGRNAIDVLDACEYFRRFPMNPPNGTAELTFHSTDPTSIIDWIMIPSDWQFQSYDVNESQLSDHRPVVAEVQQVFLRVARNNIRDNNWHRNGSPVPKNR